MFGTLGRVSLPRLHTDSTNLAHVLLATARPRNLLLHGSVPHLQLHDLTTKQLFCSGRPILTCPHCESSVYRTPQNPTEKVGTAQITRRGGSTIVQGVGVQRGEFQCEGGGGVLEDYGKGGVQQVARRGRVVWGSIRSFNKEIKMASIGTSRGRGRSRSRGRGSHHGVGKTLWMGSDNKGSS
eukprot:761351-Hanusia_phi.AAC.3